jgi:hypothetical protein
MYLVKYVRRGKLVLNPPSRLIVPVNYEGMVTQDCGKRPAAACLKQAPTVTIVEITLSRQAGCRFVLPHSTVFL